MRTKELMSVSRCRSFGRAGLAALLTLAAWQAAASEAVEREGERGDAPEVVVYVPVSPSLLVVADNAALVMLHADVARGQDGAAIFAAGYLASPDVADATPGEGARRARDAALLILQTYGALLPQDVRLADVAAIHGMPGTMGAALLTHLAREGAGWTVTGVSPPQHALVPTVQFARSPTAEQAAETAAETFLRRTDERDGDAAWALASAALKASLSRSSFEQVLWPERWSASHGARRELFRQYQLRGPALGTGDVVLLCFASQTNAEIVQMRLDDDQTWRVAGYARLGGGEGPEAPAPSAAPRTPPRQVAATVRADGMTL